MLPRAPSGLRAVALALLVALPAGAGAGAARAQSLAAEAARAPQPETDIRRRDIGGPDRDAVVGLSGCTGVLITPDKVLSAAHCLPEPARVPRPTGAAPHACGDLPDQSRVAGAPWEDGYRWYDAGIRFRVHIGATFAEPELRLPVEAYSLPRCADMVLMRLARPVPEDVARPLPVLSHAPVSGRLPRRDGLRHATFAPWAGGGPGGRPRATGRVLYWGENDCVIIGLPPLRSDGRRLASGDSGSPLLMAGRDGEEIVAGILFVIGQPDRSTCGTIRPAPREQYGSWTPTWRSPVPGTAALDIGAWLRRMAPEADHR